MVTYRLLQPESVSSILMAAIRQIGAGIHVNDVFRRQVVGVQDRLQTGLGAPADNPSCVVAMAVQYTSPFV
jgi:hypothetical protein